MNQEMSRPNFVTVSFVAQIPCDNDSDLDVKIRDMLHHIAQAQDHDDYVDDGVVVYHDSESRNTGIVVGLQDCKDTLGGVGALTNALNSVMQAQDVRKIMAMKNFERYQEEMNHE